MHKRLGFTAVELVVVIAVIGILLGIGVVSYRSTQVVARDRQRASDVAAIQAYLEAIYPREIKNSSGYVIKHADTYPALPRETSDTTAELELIFSELDNSVLTPPGASSPLSMPSIPPNGSYSPSGDPCGNYIRCYTRPSGITGSINQYIFAPGPSSDALCAKETSTSTSNANTYSCRGYSIIYRTEADNTRVVVESKRR